MNIFCRECEQMVIINKDEISEGFLLETFIKNPSQTVYVVEKEELDKLIGIITLGDFRRSQRDGKRLVNTHFTVCKSEEEAVQILRAKEKIVSVPLVDEHGGVVAEYVKKLAKAENIPYSVYCQVCGDIAEECFASKKVVFVGVPEECREFLEKILEGKVYSDRVEVLWDISYHSLQAACIGDDTFLIDFDEQGYHARELVYQKVHVETFFWNNDYKYIDYDGGIEQYVCDRVSYFTDIAVLSQSPDYLSGIDRSNVKKHYLDIHQLGWSENRGCYVYYGDISEQVECLFCRLRINYTDYIYLEKRNRILPIIDMGVHLITNKWKNEEYDIAINVIPKLMENGIQTFIFNDPDNEYEKIEGLCDENIYNRDLNVISEENLQIINSILNAGEGSRLDYRRDFMCTPFWVRKGRISYPNRKSRYCNYTNGERYTVGNSLNSPKTFYLFGPCIMEGAFVEDSCTMGSYLRPMLLEDYYISNCGQVYADINFSIRSKRYRTGDIVVLIVQYPEIFEKKGLPVYSIIDAYRKVGNISKNVYECLKHCNKRVTKEVAYEIYRTCKDNGELGGKTDEKQDVRFGCVSCIGNFGIPRQMENWLSEIKSFAREGCGRTGAIVMNANPFTKGHRYLVEKALEEVGVLYVFVLEENKSDFTFEDRLAMVKVGTADLENVIVLPSGKFIISTTTMPGYFNKETVPFVESDAVNDLELFGIIAKELNISVRFAGEEPIDLFTNQYNQSMSRILPDYGIRFYEIPRIEMGGQVISASRVRKCIYEKRFEEVKSLVLAPVYEYLVDHCFLEES
ncbi:hypothetical protein D7V96_12185 [bacterium D16-59]|nr:hypothetical protein D7V96_12185 [bacterium D16-59]